MEHFQPLARLALVAYGPVIALALLRIAKCRLVDAGVIPAAVGGAIGAAAVIAHALTIIFLVPVSIALCTPLVVDVETERRRSSRSPRSARLSWAEIRRCLRGSLVPTTLVTSFSLALILGLRIPLEWLNARVGLEDLAHTPVGMVAVVVLVETLTIFALARAVRGFTVYPAVVAMESCTGLAALRRSRALTRPCQAEAANALVFHLGPRSLFVPWYMLALAQLSGLPYGVIINTASDTQMSGVALLGLYAMHVLIAPFGMTALALLYLKARRIEGGSLSSP